MSSIVEPLKRLALAPSAGDKPLNDQLYQAVCRADEAACRRLIEMRADVNNADNRRGKTPLQIALGDDDSSVENLSLAKVLIDKGATVSVPDALQIQRSLMACGVLQRYTWPFIVRRPDPASPEVLFDGQFVPIASIPNRSIFTRPIAHFHLADEPLVARGGYVAREFGPQLLSMYEQIAEYFTVTRDLVDHRDKLVPATKRLQECFPRLSISYMHFSGHSIEDLMFFDAEKNIVAALSSDDGQIMQELALAVHRHGVIAFGGCKCARDGGNLVESFSRRSDGRIVCGSRYDVACTTFVVLLPGGNRDLPILIPRFRVPSKNPPDETDPPIVTVYQNGEVLLQDSSLDPATDQRTIIVRATQP